MCNIYYLHPSNRTVCLSFCVFFTPQKKWSQNSCLSSLKQDALCILRFWFDLCCDVYVADMYFFRPCIHFLHDNLFIRSWIMIKSRASASQQRTASVDSKKEGICRTLHPYVFVFQTAATLPELATGLAPTAIVVGPQMVVQQTQLQPNTENQVKTNY